MNYPFVQDSYDKITLQGSEYCAFFNLPYIPTIALFFYLRAWKWAKLKWKVFRIRC